MYLFMLENWKWKKNKNSQLHLQILKGFALWVLFRASLSISEQVSCEGVSSGFFSSNRTKAVGPWPLPLSVLPEKNYSPTVQTL